MCGALPQSVDNFIALRCDANVFVFVFVFERLKSMYVQCLKKLWTHHLFSIRFQ